MDSDLATEHRTELFFMLAGAVLVAIIAFFLSRAEVTGLLAGYFLGLFVIFSNFLIIWWIRDLEGKKVVRRFITGFATRFLIILALYVALLFALKNAQIFFTLSFVVSYIFHSVIDIILIHKKTSENKASKPT